MFLDKIITYKALLNYARFSWWLSSKLVSKLYWTYVQVDRYLLPPLGCSAVFTPLAPGRNCRGRALSLSAPGSVGLITPAMAQCAPRPPVAAVVACAQTQAGVDVPGLLRSPLNLMLL